MTQQENIIKEYEKKYNELLEQIIKKYDKIEEEQKNKNNNLGGVLA